MDEFMVWQAYITKRGSINVARRIGVEVGLLRYMTAKANGDKESAVEDFLPYEDGRAGGDRQASFEEIAFLFQCHAPS